MAEALRRTPGVELTVRRLKLGDYLVDRRLLVERKTIADLGRSIRDGRLFRQAWLLVRAPVRSCLLVEGRVGDATRVELPRGAVQGALISVSLCLGLPLLRSRSPAETAWLLRVAATQLARREARGTQRYCRRPSTVLRTQLLLLQAVPEIGPRRAAALLTAFSTPAAIANASERELAAVPGIGAECAGRLHRALHTAAASPASSGE